MTDTTPAEWIAPGPAVETVARELGQHWPEWDATHLGCSCDGWRSAEAIDEAACSAAEAAHEVYRAEAVVAAQRAAAGTADVDDLYETAHEASALTVRCRACCVQVGTACRDWPDRHGDAPHVTRTIDAAVRAVLDRLAITRRGDGQIVTPEGHCEACGMKFTEDGSCPWCDREDPTPAPTPVPVAAGGEPWRVGTHYGIHVYTGDEPIATFHRAEDAATAVGAVNAALRAGGAS